MYTIIFLTVSLFSGLINAKTENQDMAFLQATLYEMQLTNLSVEIDPQEVLRQEKLIPGMLFKDAFTKALTSLLSDSDDEESPLAIVKDSIKDETIAALTLKTFLNRPTSQLWLFTKRDMPDFTPIRGETLTDHWIFLLTIPDLSDHIFYIIVPRNTLSKAHNYGFN